METTKGEYMTYGPTLAEAEQLDEQDDLAGFTQRFVVDDPELIYFDGNSLGRLAKSAASRIQHVVQTDWGQGLIRSWDHWMDWPTDVGDRLAEHVIGAFPGEVVVSDSTTVNFYKLLVAALDARPDRRAVIIDRHNFPTDRYVVEGLAQQRSLEVHWIEGDPIEGVQPADVARVLDDQVAVVTLSHLEYRCGAIADLSAISALARDAGALNLWDLSHSAGSMPVGLDGGGADRTPGGQPSGADRCHCRGRRAPTDRPGQILS